MAAYRPEAELLLHCARVREESESAARLEALLRENIDWAYLLDAASGHRMMPLLFRRLNDACPEAVPGSVLDRLRDDFRDNTRHNLVLTKKLLEIVGLFEEHDVPVVPYKGPTLAALAYGNLGHRQFGDLDILVQRRDVPKAKELLGSLGYRPLHSLTHAQEAAFFGSWGHYVFVDDGNEEVVELHWPVAERHYFFRFFPEQAWGRLRCVPLGGGTVRTFAPEDLLLILCEHGSKHLWERLSWIHDVASLIQAHREIEWERLVREANASGSERMLFLGLRLASDLLGATLPPEISEKVRGDPVLETLIKRVRKKLFSEATGPREVFAEALLRSSHLLMRRRWRDKVWYYARMALPTEDDCAWVRLPRPLFPLYYAVRPVRLAGEYGRKLLGLPS